MKIQASDDEERRINTQIKGVDSVISFFSAAICVLSYLEGEESYRVEFDPDTGEVTKQRYQVNSKAEMYRIIILACTVVLDCLMAVRYNRLLKKKKVLKQIA